MNDSAGTITIQPVTAGHEQYIRDLTGEYIYRAGKIYNREFPTIPVIFDLKGRAAGMYRVQSGERVIRFNPYIFAKYPDDNIASTVPHEVAHYVVDMLYGVTHVRPHGAEWQKVMLALGAEPKVTANYDLSGIPVRRQRRHAYQCDCTIHQISAARHNKIRLGKARYFCRYCMAPLKSAAT